MGVFITATGIGGLYQTREEEKLNCFSTPSSFPFPLLFLTPLFHSLSLPLPLPLHLLSSPIFGNADKGKVHSYLGEEVMWAESWKHHEEGDI